MVIDLKVLVRSFNCENRACYVGNPRESFFEFAKVKFCFAKVSRKLGIIIIICKGLPPTAARGPAGEGHQRMRVAVAKFPKVRLCESQTPRPLVFAFPSVHPLLMAGVCEYRDIFAKVPRKLCERAGESQSACWRGASKLCKKNLSWEGIPWC